MVDPLSPYIYPSNWVFFLSCYSLLNTKKYKKEITWIKPFIATWSKQAFSLNWRIILWKHTSDFTFDPNFEYLSLKGLIRDWTEKLLDSLTFWIDFPNFLSKLIKKPLHSSHYW